MGLHGIVFAIPVFVQVFLNFTLIQSGYLLMPGGIPSAFAAIFMGKITQRFDARIVIGRGAVLTAGTAFVLADINLIGGNDTLFFPMLLCGVGTVVIFLPLLVLLRRICTGCGPGF